MKNRALIVRIFKTELCPFEQESVLDILHQLPRKKRTWHFVITLLMAIIENRRNYELFVGVCPYTGDLEFEHETMLTLRTCCAKKVY